ncbi:MAG: hypothetical protein J5865_03975 [Lachnospiraceae bacterium]|nr:hypothetical protein [Lachnospiraceae bacterium]
MVGLVLCVIFARLANKDHKTKTEYDERQKAIRGRGYMFGFYTLLIFEAVIVILGMSGVELPVDAYLVHFAGILIGLLVFVCYCIWNDGYWGINNDRKRYAIIFAVAALLNAIPIVGVIRDGTLYKDGKFSIQILNVMVLAMLIIVILVLAVKGLVDRRAED